MHEFGHTLGLNDSGEVRPEDSPTGWRRHSWDGPVSAMGHPHRYPGYNAPQRAHLGWLPAASVLRLATTSHVHRLVSLRSLHLQTAQPMMEATGAVAWACGGSNGCPMLHQDAAALQIHDDIFLSFRSGSGPFGRFLRYSGMVEVHHSYYGGAHGCRTTMLDLIDAGQHWDGRPYGDTHIVVACAKASSDHHSVVITSYNTTLEQTVAAAQALCPPASPPAQPSSPSTPPLSEPSPPAPPLPFAPPLSP
eukprot:5180887-Prymnesium_polylepis.2